MLQTEGGRPDRVKEYLCSCPGSNGDVGHQMERQGEEQKDERMEDDRRYVDDARVYLYPIRGGWRWESGDLWYKKEWEEEDALISPTEKTKRVVYGSMQGLTKCLAFTAETSEDFGFRH